MQFGDPVIENLEAFHPQYDEKSPSWIIMDDCFQGELRIKEKGRDYLPALYNQGEIEYENYKQRAYWYGATRRVVQGNVGMLLANDPSLHVEESMKGDAAVLEFYNSLAADGSSFSELLRRISSEFVLKGRVGVLVDGSQDEQGVFKPKVIRYQAQNIINWDIDRFQENTPIYKLRYVVLEENRFTPKDEVPWERERTKQWRVLWLDEKGFYNQCLYKKKKRDLDPNNLAADNREVDQYEIIEGSLVMPTKGGNPMTEIPFWILNYGGDTSTLEEPPLMEMALMNISHYRTVASIENARSYCGTPTLTMTGVEGQPGVGSVALGTGKAIAIENEAAQIQFLELSGTGLAGLEKAMDQKELAMGILGSRLLLPEPAKGQEAVLTHKIRRKGEMSILSSMSDVISNKLTEIARFAAEWGMKANPMQFKVSLVKEFSTINPDSGMLVTLSKLVGMRLMSFETFFELMKKMELFPAGADFATELQKIESGQGSEIIAELIAMEHAPKVEKIDVERENGNSNGQGGRKNA